MADARWRPAPFVSLSLAAHGVALASMAAWPTRWSIGLGAILANQVALILAGMWPRSGLIGANLTRVPADVAGARVALTFDDGPHPELTPLVVKRLAAARARCSFFVVGQRLSAAGALVREVVAAGHRLENHSETHSHRFAFRGPRGLLKEIGAAQESIHGAVGRRPVFFRAPAGMRNPWVDPVLARLGLRLVSWTRRGYDAVLREPRAVAERLLRGVGGGDILVLHDGPGDRRTLEALDRVLEGLAARGLECVTLDELVTPPSSRRPVGG